MNETKLKELIYAKSKLTKDELHDVAESFSFNITNGLYSLIAFVKVKTLIDSKIKLL